MSQPHYQKIDYQELTTRVSDRHVVVMGGYSVDYDPRDAQQANDLKQIETFADDLVREVKTYGERIAVVIGGTALGIGKAYEYVKTKAREAGLPEDQIVTAGIVAEKYVSTDKLSPFCDLIVPVASSTSELRGSDGELLMADISRHGKSAQINYFGGGRISVLEVKEAVDIASDPATRTEIGVFVRDMPRPGGGMSEMHEYLRGFGHLLKGDWYELFRPPVRPGQRAFYGVPRPGHGSA